MLCWYVTVIGLLFATAEYVPLYCLAFVTCATTLAVPLTSTQSPRFIFTATRPRPFADRRTLPSFSIHDGRYTDVEDSGTMTETSAYRFLGVTVISMVQDVVASALAFATPHEILPFVGKGWLDSTRIAGSNPQLWRQILEENRAPALHALKKFATICETWIEALEGSDFDRIEELLQSGKTTRESVASRHSPG